MKKLLLSVIGIMIAGSVLAGDISVKPVVSAGLGFGGDTLSEVPVTTRTYSYGRLTNVSSGSSEIKAGEGYLLNAGALFDFNNIPLEILAQAGWFHTSDNVDGWDASFVRYPIDIIAYYKINNHRIGAGLTYHMNAKFEDDFGGDVAVDFKNALGEVIDYTYSMNNFRFFARYTIIKYDADSLSLGGYNFSPDFDVTGNSFSIGASWAFGK